MDNTPMMQPFYDIVKKPELASKGYIREQSETNIPESIKDMVVDYFGYFYPNPNEDESNFITENDITKSLKLKDDGNKLMKEKKYDDALKVYTKALSCNPNDGKIFGNRSLCYLKLNILDLAFSDSERCIHLEPTWYKSWLRLAQIYEAMKEYAECLNMIEHSLKICVANDDKKNSKILQRYFKSITNKEKEYDELHPNELNINHLNDKDREEWAHCELGYMDESKLSDKELLNASPYKIHFYSEFILPKRLHPSNYPNKNQIPQEIMSELHRWWNRKWIRKIGIFKKLNICKSLLNFDEYIIEKAQIKHGDMWTISWSALYNLYSNKRFFGVRISSMLINGDYDGDIIFNDGTYCKPNSKYLIQCIKKAMLFPTDAMREITQQIKNGVDKDDITYSRRPYILEVQYRMKDEFEDIKKEMSKYGIVCKLISFQDTVEICKKCKTNPYGWNYLDQQPYYQFESQNTLDIH